MNPDRPAVPPKPKLFVSCGDLRDSGISVWDEPMARVTPATSGATLSPRAAGGVRQLASRFESIGLRYSTPLLSASTPDRLRKAPSIRHVAASKPVIAPKPKSKDITHSQRARAHEERANAIAEHIYDTVCARAYADREGSDHDGEELSSEPLYEEMPNTASTDGYSSFESSTDDEDTPAETYYSSVIPKGGADVLGGPATCYRTAFNEKLTALPSTDDEDTPARHYYSSVIPKGERCASNEAGDHIGKVIAELLEKERRYIATLEQGINNYVPKMYSQTLPAALRGQRDIIFINLEEILCTHRDHLLPDLERAAATPTSDGRQREGRVVEKLAQTFLDYIEEERFYCYVQYAMHHAESETKRLRYSDYFLKVQHDLNDRLGLNSLLLQPIQRLPRYKLLMNEMVKDLLKEADGKQTMNRRTALLCKLDKRLSQLIDRVNQAISIREIRQCSGSAPTKSLSHTINTPPTLILHPEGNRNPDRDTPINLLYQGRFMRLFLLDIYDVSLRRKYAGKLFAFEKLLIYVEILRDRLEYRGHYFNKEICYTEEGTNRVVLFARTAGTQEIIVQSETHTELRPLLTRLQQMARSVIYDNTPRMGEHVIQGPASDERTFEYDQNDHAYEDVLDDEQPEEVWDEERLTRSLIDAQEQFLEVLDANQSFYLDPLGVEQKQKLTGFLKTFEAIKQLHKDILRDISASPHGPNTICQCFENYLLADVLEPYFPYLRDFRKAVKCIQHSQTPSNFHNRVASTVEKFTFLCIEHLQEFNRYFETLIVKYSDDSTLNRPIDTALFQRIAFVQVRLNAYRSDLVLNYNLFLLDERLPACGLVFYNDRAVLSGTYRDVDAGPCRLFVCERAAVCVKLHDIPEQDKTVERFVRVVFIDRFAGRGMLMKARRSKRRPQGVNFTIDGVKFRVDFFDRTSQNKFFQNYVDKYTKM